MKSVFDSLDGYEYPLTAKGAEWAKGVIDGSIPHAKRARRHIEYFSAPREGYWFDAEKAEAICVWFQTYVYHHEGEMTDLPIALEPWQCWLLGMIEGWRKRNEKGTDVRKFRIAHIEIPRKNGKTILASGWGIYLTTSDGEKGAKVYAAASQYKQAKLAVIGAWRMARHDRLQVDLRLARHGSDRINPSLEVMTATSGEPRSPDYEGTGDQFVAVAQDREGSLDGLNASGVIIDEVHAHPNSSTWDALELSTRSRRQPLTFSITTQGNDRSGLAAQQRDYIDRLVSGDIVDESYFGVVWAMDEDDPDAWMDPDKYGMWSPNYGVSIFRDGLLTGIGKAMNSPVARTAWLQKNCGVTGISTDGWLDMDKWDEASTKVKWKKMRKRPCLAISVDLSKRTNFASICYLSEAKGGYQCRWDFFVPKGALEENPLYLKWAADDEIQVMPGNAISPRLIREHLDKRLGETECQRVYFDAMQGNALMEYVSEEWGVEAVKVAKNATNYGPAMIRAEELLLNGNLTVDDSPVARWCVANTEVRNVEKPFPTPMGGDAARRIDGALTMLMCTLSTITADKDDDEDEFEDWELDVLIDNEY